MGRHNASSGVNASSGGRATHRQGMHRHDTSLGGPGTSPMCRLNASLALPSNVMNNNSITTNITI